MGCFESEKEAICALDAAPPPPRLSNAARCHGSKVAACGAELPRSHGNGVPPQLPGGVAVSWAPPAETSGTPPEASRLPHALRTHTPTHAHKLPVLLSTTTMLLLWFDQKSQKLREESEKISHSQGPAHPREDAPPLQVPRRHRCVLPLVCVCDPLAVRLRV